MVLRMHAVDHNLRIGAGCDNGLVVDHYPDTGFASKQERHQEVCCSSHNPNIFCGFVDTLSRTDSMLDTLVLYTVTTGSTSAFHWAVLRLKAIIGLLTR